MTTETRNRLIYLDSAATSLQKPPTVYEAVQRAMRTMASPGRGGHVPAMRAAETAWLCREAIADMYGVRDPARVIFTMNATHGLNIALRSLVHLGDRVVVSGYEHNAVMRTLQLIGANADVAQSPLFDRTAAIEAFQDRLTGAKAAVLCHVSNVFGCILPLQEIAELCRKENVPLVVDASQSAGSIPFDFDALGLRFAAMPGHKGLLGPQGTGVLICSEPVDPLLAGGTGSDSLRADMPDYLPDRVEAGTHNMPGIAGLLAGVTWIREQKPERILRHERYLTKIVADLLSGTKQVKLYAAPDEVQQGGLLSFTVDGVDCETVAAYLSRVGVAVRAGYHCAPLAHQSGGTGETGTIRFSFSPFNTEKEVRLSAEKLRRILKNF